MGIERPVGTGVMGLALGYGPSTTDILGRSEARGAAQSTQVAMYGSWGVTTRGRQGGQPGVSRQDGQPRVSGQGGQPVGRPADTAWEFSGIASYGWNQVSSRRDMQVDGHTSTATARYPAATWAVEAHVRLVPVRDGVPVEADGAAGTRRLRVEPGLGFRLVTVQQPGFTEDGEHGLEIREAAFRSQRALLGLRLVQEFGGETGYGEAEVRLGYERELGDSAPQLVARLHRLNGDWYTVRGTEVGRDFFTVDVGFQAWLQEQVVLRGGLEMTWAARYSAHSAQLSLQYVW